MQPIATLAQAVVLFGSTLLIIVADRAWRRSRDFATSTGIPRAEPGWGTLLLFTFLCNIAALPVYFYQTRGSGLWALLGVVAFGFCFGASVVAAVVVGLVLGVAT